MGFSRGLANVVTFGAASRVDKAGNFQQGVELALALSYNLNPIRLWN